MKSLKYGIIFSSILLVVTGCGGEAKTLNCNTDDESLGNQEVSIEFAADGAVENMDMRMFMDYGYVVSEEILVSTCEDFTSEEGVSCDSTTSGTAIMIEVDYDFNKMSKESRVELIGHDQDYHLVKYQFETLGYACE